MAISSPQAPCRGLPPQPDRPGCPDPGAQEAPGKEVEDDRPVRGDVRERHSGRAEGKRRCDHDKAHGLIEDDGFKCREPKPADEQRQPELCSTKPDQPA